MKYISVADDVRLGTNVKIADFVNLYGCVVGDNTKIGTFVEIQKKALIGVNCKIQSHTFICEGVIIEDNVFIGHGVTFVNDKYPRATNGNGRLQTEADWSVAQTIVKKGATIGSGATILCNITIGENSIVGAGSVVTRDVPPDTVVAGCPARAIRGIREEEACLQASCPGPSTDALSGSVHRETIAFIEYTHTCRLQEERENQTP